MRLAIVGRRALGGVIVLIGVSILAFSLIHMLPGDTANAIAGEFATPDQVEAIRKDLGLDQPILVQYFTWLFGVLRGDIGTSLSSGRPAFEMILESVPPTVSIAIVSLIISTTVGVLVGTTAAVNRGGWADHFLSFLTSVGISTPAFWVLLILLVPLAILNRVFPAVGYDPISEGFWPWFSHIILPATALAVGNSAEVARYTRGSAIDVLAAPYIRAARARGAGGWWLTRNHVFRNASIPVITVIGLQLGNLFGGVIVVENVAGINGLGQLAINTIFNRDYILLQAYVLFAATVIVIANLIVDLLYSVINPKVR